MIQTDSRTGHRSGTPDRCPQTGRTRSHLARICGPATDIEILYNIYIFYIILCEGVGNCLRPSIRPFATPLLPQKRCGTGNGNHRRCSSSCPRSRRDCSCSCPSPGASSEILWSSRCLVLDAASDAVGGGQNEFCKEKHDKVYREYQEI